MGAAEGGQHSLRRNETRLRRNETRLRRNETRLRRKETRLSKETQAHICVLVHTVTIVDAPRSLPYTRHGHYRGRHTVTTVDAPNVYWRERAECAPKRGGVKRVPKQERADTHFQTLKHTDDGVKVRTGMPSDTLELKHAKRLEEQGRRAEPGTRGKEVSRSGCEK